MKKLILSKSILSSFLLISLANAEPDISGKFTYETSKYTSTGTLNGETTAHGKDVFKGEASARIYVDGNVDAIDGTYHLELQAFNDGKTQINDYTSGEEYTQRDPLREAYIDTSYNDWLIRLGKQQVVWGTADGAKLLDTINPTDYSEMAQNQMEDSRIPVWMLNAEKDLESGGNLQVIVSQPKENIFAGLDRNISTHKRFNGTRYASSTDDYSNTNSVKGHQQGSPFMLQGVDSITGKKNGFVNIVPDLGSVAQRFFNEFGQNPTYGGAMLGATHTMTVSTFAGLSATQINAMFDPTTNKYANIAYFTSTGADGAAILKGFAGAYDTNLNDTNSNRANWGAQTDTTFEYMKNTTFSTFDAFANAKSQYVYDMPDNDANLSLRYKNTTDSGVNYSVNYSYAYDKNPIIDLTWRNASGERLRVNRNTYSSGGTDYVYLTLSDSSGKRYGGYAGNNRATDGTPILRFEQTVKRAHNIGGSFDATIETDTLGPVVLRGEALYLKDVYSPVMDLTALSIGDMTNALQMIKGDRFKYVLGADITALTNMMVSFQFIQDRNLDHVDEQTTIGSWTDSKFTTDYATMHLTNGFNKAEKNKNFYSIYLSKPFGESGQHRWNNITMLEEGDGQWNRLDVEYTLDDNTLLTAEWNNYWGNKNTQFGQLKDASNVQVGWKYTF